MASKTFSPNDFKKRRPPVKDPELAPLPKKPEAAAVSRVVPSESNAAGKPVVRLMDTISLTYEPRWEKVLDNVGVAHN